MELTFEQHATQARMRARAHGLADCIHYAPNWQRRADALYAAANETGIAWWQGDGSIGLLADGRMVLTNAIVSVFEIA